MSPRVRTFVSLAIAAAAAAGLAGVPLGHLEPPVEGSGRQSGTPTEPSIAHNPRGSEPAGSNEGGLEVRGREARLALPFASHPILYHEGRAPGEPARIAWSDGHWSAQFQPGALSVSTAHDGAAAITIRLAGAEQATPTAVAGPDERVNWYTPGATSASDSWQAAATVRYADVQPGIDLVFSAASSGLKYDLELEPGASLDAFLFVVEGATHMAIRDDGGLEIHAGALSLIDQAPLAEDETHAAVGCAFELRAADAVGFSCPKWNRAHALTIDPLLYSTFVGGQGQDIVRVAVEDGAGGFYLAGDTQSPDFPLANVSSFGGIVDAFAARINSAGTLVYATFFGGDNIDRPGAIALDGAGNLLVAGSTASSNFPVSPGALDTSLNGSADAFVVKINTSTGLVVFSTYLGGAQGDGVQGIAPGPAGSIVLAGSTQSSDFPNTTGAFDRTLGGGADAFVTWLSSDGTTILASTFFGGSGGDGASSMALDSAGNVFITGQTGSTDLPVSAGAYQPSISGTGDAFVARISANGSALLFATYLGGTTQLDNGISIALAANGDVLVAGQTDASTFPTTVGAFDRSYNGGAYDVFIARLDATGSNLLFSTFVGGTGRDDVGGMGVDPGGDIYVAGTTATGDFPTTGAAFDESFNGPGGGFGDAFLVKLSGNGSTLPYSTFIGSSSTDQGYGLVVVANDTAVVFGQTFAADFPTTSSAFDSTFTGFSDGFFVRIDTRVFKIAYDTNPPGFRLTVGGYLLTAPSAVPCAASTNVSIDATDPAPSASQRYVFSSWSDGLPRAHNITCVPGLTLTASFELQYKTSIRSTPVGFNVTVDGLPQVAPLTLWWAAGSVHNISYEGPQYVSADERYVYSSWSDGGSAAHPTLANAPSNLTVALLREFRQTFGALPAENLIEVDGTNQTDGAVLWWQDGSTHAVTARTPQNETPLSRSIFDGWTDGGGPNRSVQTSGPATFEAHFAMEFNVSVATNPPGLVATVDGVNSTGNWSQWVKDGTSISVSVAALQSGANARYLFAQWSDAGASTHAIVVAGPFALVASYSSEWRVELRSEPIAVAITVDGSMVTTPVARWWPDGSRHSISAPPSSPGAALTRYALTGWGSTTMDTLNVSADGPVNLTAFYRIEYRLELLTDRAAAQCDIADCWYAAGSLASFGTANLSAGPPGTRYRFGGWNGDFLGNDLNESILISGPATVTAVWVTQYELTADTEYGSVSGAGWYDAGTAATIRLQQTTVEGPNGTFKFDGWTGASASAGPNVTLGMTGPKHLVAQWGPVVGPPPTSAFPVGLVAIAGAVAALLVVALVVLRRRRASMRSASDATRAGPPAVTTGPGERTANAPPPTAPPAAPARPACPQCSRPIANLAPRCEGCGLALIWD